MFVPHSEWVNLRMSVGSLSNDMTTLSDFRPTLDDVDFDLRGLEEEVGAGVAGVEAAVLGPRALQDQRADGRRRLVGQHAHAAAGRCVVDRLKSSRIFISSLFCESVLASVQYPLYPQTTPNQLAARPTATNLRTQPQDGLPHSPA